MANSLSAGVTVLSKQEQHAAPPTPATLRRQLQEWIAERRPTLLAMRATTRDLDGEMAYNRHVCRLLWDAGHLRWGWPASAGGRGGSPLLRAVTAEEMTFAGLVHQNVFTMPEVLGAPFAALASDQLISEYLGLYVSGEDWWCQGFSEPGAGSDLASLTTRAVRDRDCYRITGQKVWTTLAQYAQRCVLLARTGSAESKHRGITAFFVDMNSRGISVHPLKGMHDDEEFSEVFFDDVVVPADRVIGEVDKGWAVAMAILASERATIFWARTAWLQERLQSLLVECDSASKHADRIGQTYQLLSALRSRSRATQHQMESGQFSSPASSIDKVLMATSEQMLFDTALELLGDRITFGDDHADHAWRSDYFYSRAASIYGGTSEIQRNIISEHLLGLPKE